MRALVEQRLWTPSRRSRPSPDLYDARADALRMPGQLHGRYARSSVNKLRSRVTQLRLKSRGQ